MLNNAPGGWYLCLLFKQSNHTTHLEFDIVSLERAFLFLGWNGKLADAAPLSPAAAAAAAVTAHAAVVGLPPIAA